MALSETDKDVETIRLMLRFRTTFESRIAEESAVQSEDLLKIMRSENMFQMSEFYYMIDAMGLKDPNDIALITELHNERIERLAGDRQAQLRRGLSPDRLSDAIHTSDVRPRMEEIWRQQPGALDQSSLGRFLLAQMSAETTRKLIGCAVKAGFMTTRSHTSGAVVVASTGIMERVFGDCLRQTRLAIATL